MEFNTQIFSNSITESETYKNLGREPQYTHNHPKHPIIKSKIGDSFVFSPVELNISRTPYLDSSDANTQIYAWAP
jgi:hypothetical protein